MRVVIHLGERIDPGAARALWRLLFREPAPSSAEDPQCKRVQSGEAKVPPAPRSG